MNLTTRLIGISLTTLTMAGTALAGGDHGGSHSSTGPDTAIAPAIAVGLLVVVLGYVAYKFLTDNGHDDLDIGDGLVPEEDLEDELEETEGTD